MFGAIAFIKDNEDCLNGEVLAMMNIFSRCGISSVYLYREAKDTNVEELLNEGCLVINITGENSCKVHRDCKSIEIMADKLNSSLSRDIEITSNKYLFECFNPEICKIHMKNFVNSNYKDKGSKRAAKTIYNLFKVCFDKYDFGCKLEDLDFKGEGFGEF